MLGDDCNLDNGKTLKGENGSKLLEGREEIYTFVLIFSAFCLVCLFSESSGSVGQST